MDSTSIQPDWWAHTQGLRYARLVGTLAGSWRWDIASEQAVWLWLNREGEGLIWGERDRFFLKPGMYALTGGEQAGSWSCIRHAGGHGLDLVVMSREWLAGRLGGQAETLRQDLGGWLKGGGSVAFCGLMGMCERDLCAALARAGRTAGPGRLLVEAKLLEWAAARLFCPAAVAGPPNGHLPAGGLVDRALCALRAQLDQALDLPALARKVGSSPHHLSRSVPAKTGMTLQRHLRRLRIDRACEVLASGRLNVTEVALDCGYQSLSHFAKAFREETGRTPSEWLAAAKADDPAHHAGTFSI